MYPDGRVKVGVAEPVLGPTENAAFIPQLNMIWPEVPTKTVLGAAVSVVHVELMMAATVVTAGNVCVKSVIAAAAVPIIETARMARMVFRVMFRDIFMILPCQGYFAPNLTGEE